MRPRSYDSDHGKAQMPFIEKLGMNRLLKFFIRPEKRVADTGYLVLAAFVGGAAGVLLAYKVSLWVGLPFALGATLMLFFTWRAPNPPPLLPNKTRPGQGL